MNKRIISQELMEGFVKTTYGDGTMEDLPYKINEYGENYIDLFPNAELEDYNDLHKN
jgi:hypothetical protein